MEPGAIHTAIATMTRATAIEVSTARRERKLVIGLGRHTFILGVSQLRLRIP